MNKQTQEALKMAIEVMEGRCAWGKSKQEVILICKEALEQPAQKPWPKHKPECTLHDIVLDSVSRNLSYEQIKEETNGLADEYMVSLYRDGMNYQINKQVQGSEVQEPVNIKEPMDIMKSIQFDRASKTHSDVGDLIFEATNPAPAREPLSEEEMRKLYKRSTTLVYSDFVEDVRAIERVHGIV